MDLISNEFVKSNFSLWEDYASQHSEVVSEAKTSEQILTETISQSQIELLEYIKVTEETITDQLKSHLLNIVRKRLFDIRHGDTEFQSKPGIIRDYEATIAMLERYREGELLSPAPELGSTKSEISLTAKDRLFDGWFR